MSEMFTKIGGYIASGDAMVYADSATMTGDGTVASPFGVNKTDMFVQSPLFTGTSGEGSATSAYIGWRPDETVLWENDGSFSAKDLTAGFGEPASSFEKLKFYVGTDIQNKNSLEVTYVGGSACLTWTEYFYNTFRLWYTSLNIGNEGMTAGPAIVQFWKYTDGTLDHVDKDWEHSYKGIKKVVGINRKPEA